MSNYFEGIITFFNCNNSKRYGFIKPDEKITSITKEIFFHFNDGNNFADCGREEPIFIGGKFLGEEPRKGDRVVFSIAWTRSEKPKACPWGHLRDYEATEAIIAKKNRKNIYRLWEQITFDDRPPQEPRILWKGSDVFKLSIEYDTLVKHYSNPLYKQKIWFELLVDSGVWKPCEDPRP